MNPIAIGAIALGVGAVAYETHKSTTPPSAPVAAAVASGKAALDPAMDRLVATTVGQALQKETDPSVLLQLGTLLKAAGFTASASAISAKAGTLSSNITSSATGTAAVAKTT